MSTTLKINLLKSRHTLSEREYLREQQWYRYSLIGLVVVVVVALAAVGYQLILGSRLAAVEDGISQATRELAGYTDANAKQIYLKSRLNLISAFLDSRSVSREALQNVFSITIPGVVLTGVKFGDDNLVLAQFEADNAVVLAGLVDYLQADNQFFVQAVSRGVTRSDKGKYRMETELTIPKE